MARAGVQQISLCRLSCSSLSSWAPATRSECRVQAFSRPGRKICLFFFFYFKKLLSREEEKQMFPPLLVLVGDGLRLDCKWWVPHVQLDPIIHGDLDQAASGDNRLLLFVTHCMRG